jgi:hypothetical protein
MWDYPTLPVPAVAVLSDDKEHDSMTIRHADNKGRILLGSRFANVTFIVEDGDPGQVVLKPAVAIPAQEAWLYQNETALTLVRKGLAEARNREFTKAPPDLDADAEMADQLEG